MLLMGKLEKFVVKRVFVFVIILGLFNLVFMRQKLVISAGLLTGSAIGVLRFKFLSVAFFKHLKNGSDDNGSKVWFIGYFTGCFLTIAALVISARLDKWFFAGVVASILIIPAIIMINGITEYFGLTNNHFE